LVSNGDDILQLGKSTAKGTGRLGMCIRGALAKRHNKAFICALGEAALGQKNAYLWVPCEDPDSVEQRFMDAIGIRRNQDGATLIEEFTGTSIEEAHIFLWEKFQNTPQYESLNPVGQQMALELFELITFGRVYITRRSERVQKSVQGDILEGNILMNIGKRYLISIFQKMTDKYLRYGSHKLPESEFRVVAANYSYVSCGRKNFDIKVSNSI
jgi:hypothetical protein